MSGFQSALYRGSVMHRRLRPKQHSLRYSIFYLLLDLDEIDALAHKLRLFSRNRFNLFSFHDRDHGGTEAISLRDGIERHLQEAGLDFGGPIRLLAMPRILGYAFNPLSIYFCHRRDQSLSAICYEVNNTFGQRHNYLIPVPSGVKAPIRQESRKSLFVSPFLTTDMDYTFRVVPPDKELSVSVIGGDTAGPLIVAKLVATRQELTDASLARAFVAYPLMTFKVVAGIHWEAVLLWLKGVRLNHRPSPPAQPVTLGHAAMPAVNHPEKNSANGIR
ncbi:DUF1365 domain-containing protein [Chelatococcus asaccharovorans]|uniref:DUF1365 family protein n=1 Tax=Chelatococcus asaccharovorans TaxID=28210 RepID=A0A2V3UBT2_9HYPH|nr:DUF1365 family protein [Chelatococcus asaccharovorans]MBS7703628.1 DUF1365 family protein [Chelatococcus asaccharovorans]PXW61973.1 hypothetical protein C7450_103495 [Chelatococcus asaccharovorans]